MKILKLLFSKIFISGLALLVQAYIFIAVLYYFEQYFVAVQIFSLIISLLVLLYIVNRKESPEFKLPWIFMIIVLPFFGLVIYLMFGRANIQYKHHKRALIINCRCENFTSITKEEERELSAVLGEYNGIEQYLRKNSLTRGYLHNKTQFFKSGEQFHTDLLNELGKAEKFIFLEYFIINYGKMWDSILRILTEKVKAGVEVRIMYDDIGSAGLLRNNYYKKLRKLGINCVKFNPFRPVITGIHNNRDHRKIAIIDGKTAYTGGVNLSDEYINLTHKLGHWKDTAIKIQGPAVKSFTLMFLRTFDSTAKKLSADYGKYFETVELNEDTEEGYVHAFGDGPRPSYNELVGSNNFINIISSAKEYVYISTPYLIPDHNLMSALRNAAFRGVDVRIITPHIPDKKIIFNMSRSNYKYLMEAGVKIFEYTPGFIHSKCALADGKIAFVGTINLDYRSLVHHYECGAVLYKTSGIDDIAEDFEETFARCTEITEENYKMNFIASLINAVLNLFSPML